MIFGAQGAVWRSRTVGGRKLDIESLENALNGGRELNEFDARAVAIVAQLIQRVREARAIIAEEGPVAAKGSGEPIEHPAVKVERMASAEIRGWVKERPDLFGAQEEDKTSSNEGVGVFPGLRSVGGGT